MFHRSFVKRSNAISEIPVFNTFRRLSSPRKYLCFHSTTLISIVVRAYYSRFITDHLLSHLAAFCCSCTLLRTLLRTLFRTLLRILRDRDRESCSNRASLIVTSIVLKHRDQYYQRYRYYYVIIVINRSLT